MWIQANRNSVIFKLVLPTPPLPLLARNWKERFLAVIPQVPGQILAPVISCGSVTSPPLTAREPEKWSLALSSEGKRYGFCQYLTLFWGYNWTCMTLMDVNNLTLFACI